MSKDLCDRLIKLLRRCMAGKGSVTFGAYEIARRSAEPCKPRNCIFGASVMRMR